MAKILKTLIGHQKQLAQLFGVIDSQKISSCYLLAGPSGIGKKKVAFAFAQEVLCTKGRPACGECGSCLKVEKNEHEELWCIRNVSIRNKNISTQHWKKKKKKRKK